MKQQRIILRENHIGQIAFTDIYTKEGFTVIPKGATITINLLHALQKRKNPALYFTLLPKHVALSNTDSSKRQDEWVKFTPKSPIKDPINKSKPISQSLTRSSVPFYTFLTQLHPKHRTSQYKKSIRAFHASMVVEIKMLFSSIIKHETLSLDSINSTIEKILNIFVQDKNILINLCHANDAPDYLYTHALNVCIMSMNIAIAKGHTRDEVFTIGTAALLQDIGMLYANAAIRTDKQSLGLVDTFEIKSHPTISANILDSIRDLHPCVSIVAMQVHERENGFGYPKGIKSNSIHPYAKIIAVADVYIAMISSRPYREAKRPYFAIKELVSMSYKGFLDKYSVKQLLNYISIFPIGSLVVLNNNSLAKVISAHQSSLDKPEVSIIVDSAGTLLKDEEVVQEQLYDNPALSIIGTRGTFDGVHDLMLGF